MTKIERMHEERINALDKRVEVLAQKVDDAIAESRADRAEMKKEIRAINQRMDEKFDKMDEKFDKMNQRLDNALSSMHTLAVTSTIGVGAMIVAIIIGFFK